MTPSLTTAQLADRVGVPAGTLRIWEARYGFPSPTRLPGGHRRYVEHDAELVREVLRLRRGGTSLGAAIVAVTSRERADAGSIFASVSRRWPELQPLVLQAPALLALTRAVEDEYLEKLAPGVLIGSFQHVRRFRRAQGRWKRLAAVSDAALVLADFRSPRRTSEGIYEVPVARGHPLTREWAIVAVAASDASAAGACLAGWEIPGVAGGRRFEVVLSTDPAVAHAAAADVVGLADTRFPAAARALASALGPAPSTGGADAELRSAQAVTHRLLDYLLARR